MRFLFCRKWLYLFIPWHTVYQKLIVANFTCAQKSHPVSWVNCGIILSSARCWRDVGAKRIRQVITHGVVFYVQSFCLHFVQPQGDTAKSRRVDWVRVMMERALRRVPPLAHTRNQIECSKDKVKAKKKYDWQSLPNFCKIKLQTLKIFSKRLGRFLKLVQFNHKSKTMELKSNGEIWNNNQPLSQQHQYPCWHKSTRTTKKKTTTGTTIESSTWPTTNLSLTLTTVRISVASRGDPQLSPPSSSASSLSTLHRSIGVGGSTPYLPPLPLFSKGLNLWWLVIADQNPVVGVAGHAAVI